MATVGVLLALLCRRGLLWGSYWCRDAELESSVQRAQRVDTLSGQSLKVVEEVDALSGQSLQVFTGADVEEDGAARSEGVDMQLAPINAMGDSSSVFTISPACKDCENVCLDLATGHGQNTLQLWECNGQEGQLWYFDPGSYKIQWGGDRNKCIDAGQSLTPGTQLYLWPCNGGKQQVWSYDSTAKTIYLAESETDAAFCMDLAGGKVTYGTPVQLWNCNGLWEQQFSLSSGITLRAMADYTYCLDIAGGKPDNGTPIQLWKCNGHTNQKWSFENFQIKSMATGKCIDSGNPVQMGKSLIIWDCNGLAQQKFGYDFKMGTIYLQYSAADASVCMDIQGGQLKEGGVVNPWNCNSCWNQQFFVTGPTSHRRLTSRSEEENGRLSLSIMQPVAQEGRTNGTHQNLRSTSIKEQAQAGCPGRPSPPPPSPAPGPSPSPYILPHCSQGNQYGWPKFDTQADLQKDGGWSQYFKTVYGEVPSSGYPICTYELQMIYKGVLAQCNIKTPNTLSTNCPKNAGQYYSRMSGFPVTIQAWIYNPSLAHPSGSGYVAGNMWVEVLHSQFSMDGDATWFYYAPGTAIFMWSGNTKVYQDHPDGVQDLLGQPCADKDKECGKQFAALYKAGLKKGYDTLQFMKHADMQCNTHNNQMGNYAIEIVDLKGPGTTTCSGNGGQTRFRAGWEAKSVCDCDNSQKIINCKGFGVHR